MTTNGNLTGLIPDLQNIVEQFKTETYVYLVYRRCSSPYLIGCFTILSSAECALSSSSSVGDTRTIYRADPRIWTFSGNKYSICETIVMRRCPLDTEINKLDNGDLSKSLCSDYVLIGGKFYQDHQLCDEFDHIECYQDWKRDVLNHIKFIKLGNLKLTS